MIELRTPYLLFLGDCRESPAIKTALGLLHWRREHCAAQLRLPGCNQDLGLKELSCQDAYRAGIKTLIIGAVNAGGFLPEPWIDTLVDAAEAGLDVANGLHQRVGDIDRVRRAAAETGARLIDVREPEGELPVGTGEKRVGKRVLTVGTDCNVGKMYTALAIEDGLRRRGKQVEFKATGQTGILIAGAGVPVDAVVADFISGAVESLSPATEPDHWHVIEGQGSLHHPAFAGVTLGLVHGAQPDYLVVCHEPSRLHMRHSHMPMPSIEMAMEAALRAARLTNPDVRCVGISLNTMNLSDFEAGMLIKQTRTQLGLPVTDPVRVGIEPIVEALCDQ